MRNPFDRTSLVQGGLAALFVLILLFLVFAPASKAQAATVRFAPTNAQSVTGDLCAHDPQPDITPITERKSTC